MSVDYRPDYDPADVDSDYGHTGGEITVPTFTGDTRPFRFWCQKALPLVYDDSLSYYEVLCKMADYMNNFMTDLTTVEDSMTEFGQQFVINQQFLNSMADQLGQNVADLEAYINDRMDDFMAAYTQLQTYVNNYFDNLDVQQEINTKLDEMASDGTLNDLFDPVLETWMQQKTAQIDAAIANQDAMQAQQNSRISVLEGRMDTFSGLPSGSTSGNAELLDIRTNFLGETYPTAGDAVRASDMIASGFQSIGYTRLTEWDGNESDSRFDTIQIDVTAYKGGHMAVIANTYQFVNNIEQGAGIELFGSNVAGKTVDSNAHQYPFPDGVSGIPSPVFKDFTVLTTSVQDEERILIQLAIPEDFQYQYLKLGNVAPIPGEGYSYTQPAAIVYANSWSKTQVDPTLTIAGAAADAKATGDALSELNERLTSELNDIRESGGVNLFNVQEFASDNDISFNNGVLTAKASVLDSKKLLEDGFKPNTAYTVSFYGKNTGGNVTGNGLGIQIKYTDSGNITTYLPNSSTEQTKFTLSSNVAKTIDFIQFYYNSGATNVWELTEIQIEEGNVATEYANYYSAVDAVARKSIAEANIDISTLETITLQATERRIDSESLYQSFNDLPINKIVNLFSNIKLADGPQGYVPIGHNNINDGNYNATVITYSAESNSRAIAQVCIFYVLNGYDYDKRPRTATRYGIKSGGNIVWSEWSTLSSSMVLHSSDKVVDVNSYSTVTFADFNDAEPNAIYQVDLNVGTTILNNPSPGHSGLLMTFSFSPVSHHALVQNFYALEDSGIEMYFRYGYKQSSPTLSWTPWKKVTSITI